MPKSDVLTPAAGIVAVDATPPPSRPARTSARNRARRHRLVVNAGRLAVLVGVLGGWELSTRTKLVDPFFYGQPSKVVSQIHTWVSHGTSRARSGSRST